MRPSFVTDRVDPMATVKDQRFAVLLSLSASAALAGVPRSTREAITLRLKRIAEKAATDDIAGAGRIGDSGVALVYTIDQPHRRVIAMAVRDDDGVFASGAFGPFTG